MSNTVIQYNDTVAQLGSGAAFTSTPRDTGSFPGLALAGPGYGRFRVHVKSDQPGTLEFQSSRDNVAAYRTTQQFGVTTGESQTYESIVCLRYVQFKYTNAVGPATTVLRIDSSLVAI